MTSVSNRQINVPLAHVSPQFEADSRTYRGLNPATYLVFALCYDSLAAPAARFDPSSALPEAIAPVYADMQPRLAESFSETADGTWTVKLREKTLSHAGNELNAEDIKWTFDKVFSLGTTGAYRWGQMAGMRDPSDLEIVDRYTFRIRLRAPNPHLPAFLFCGVPQVVDQAAITAHSTDSDRWGSGWLGAGNIAGHGPYDLAGVDDQSMTFGRRSDYWADEELPETIRVDAYPTRRDALESVDGRTPTYLLGLRSDEALAIRKRSDTTLVASWGAHTYVGMNYNRPPFDDVRVRRALTLAMPYDEVLQRGFLGFARRWRSPLVSYDEWYSPSHWPDETNIEAARDLLAKAGYSGGLSLTLHVPNRPDLVRVGEIIQAAYRAVGIEVELRDTALVPPGFNPTFYIRTECGHNFNEAVYDLAHDYATIHPILPRNNAGGGVDSWLGSYPGAPQREEMFRRVLTAPTAAERKTRVMAMQKSIVDDAPVVFLAELPQISAITRGAERYASDFSNRIVQALQYQNCNSNYLPS